MMTYQECIAAIKRRIWLVLAAVIISSVSAWAASQFLIHNVFKSSATIIISKQSVPVNASPDKQNILLDSNLIKLYYNVARSDSVIDGVIGQLNLNDKTEKVRRQIDLDADYETGIIKITVKAGSYNLARDIAVAFIDSLKEQSENLSLMSEIKTIDAPKLLQDSSITHLVVNIALSAVGGGLLGILLALLFGSREQYADSIPALSGYPGINKLGALPKLPRSITKKVPLVIFKDRSLADEANRIIRANLLNAMEAENTRTIMVTSPRPSEGKSIFALNIAASMAKAGKRVLLVECNSQKPALLHIYNKNECTQLTYPIDDDANLDETAIYSISNLDIDMMLPMPSQGNQTKMALIQFEKIPDEILDRYDLIILDCASLLTCADTLMVGRLVQGVVLVADYRKITAALLDKCAQRLVQAGAKLRGVVINYLPSSKFLR